MLQTARRTRSQNRSKDNCPRDAVRSHPHGKMRNQFLKADFIQQPHNLSYQWNNQVFLKERDYVKQAIQRCLYFLSSCKHTVILKITNVNLDQKEWMTGKQMKASCTFRYSLRTKWEHGRGAGGGGDREQQEKVCTRKVREKEKSSLCQMLHCDYYLVAAALVPEMTRTPRPDPQCFAHPSLADKHALPAFTL